MTEHTNKHAFSSKVPDYPFLYAREPISPYSSASIPATGSMFF